MDLAVIEVIVKRVTIGSQSRPKFLYGSSGPVGTTESVMIFFLFFFLLGPDGVLFEALLMPSFPHVKLLGK